MTPLRAFQGPGQFQWNAGAWFGSQIGGSAWLLTGAFECGLGYRAWGLAALLVGLFVVLNVGGTALWLRRDRVAPFPAYRASLLALMVVGLVALGSIDLARWQGSLGPDRGTAENLAPGYLIFGLGVPLMIAGFTWSERATLRARERAAAGK